MNRTRGMIARLAGAWGWVIGQFAGMLLLILAGILWTRLPDRYGWPTTRATASSLSGAR